MNNCDCGAIKAQTHHYHWCSVNKPRDKDEPIFLPDSKLPYPDKVLPGWEHLWAEYQDDPTDLISDTFKCIFDLIP